MAICDICNRPGMGTVVKAKDMSEAVRRGFNPFKEGLAPDLMAIAGMGSSYDDWRAEAISGRLSLTDWNICDSCMEKLRPYLRPSFPTPEQQEERQQRKRRNWGWAFVIGSGLFALMGVCLTIVAIGYSFSPSAAEEVQKNGIIAIIAPLGCNGLWLIVWGVLLGLSIKNLRSVLKVEKQTSTIRTSQSEQNLQSPKVPESKRMADVLGYGGHVKGIDSLHSIVIDTSVPADMANARCPAYRDGKCVNPRTQKNTGPCSWNPDNWVSCNVAQLHSMWK